MTNARRQAREVALQALYAWQLSGGDPLEQARAVEGFERRDAALVESILRGVREHAAELRALIAPHLDREFERLSPVERAILLIGAYELRAQPGTPYKVVIDEAVELGKAYGGAGGYKYVNGVLHKLALELRAAEAARCLQNSS